MAARDDESQSQSAFQQRCARTNLVFAEAVRGRANDQRAQNGDERGDGGDDARMRFVEADLSHVQRQEEHEARQPCKHTNMLKSASYRGRTAKRGCFAGRILNAALTGRDLFN